MVTLSKMFNNTIQLNVLKFITVHSNKVQYNTVQQLKVQYTKYYTVLCLIIR